MHVKLMMTETELAQLIINHFKEKLGEVPFDIANLKIEVKSKQNYKSEWEQAEFRAVYEGFGH